MYKGVNGKFTVSFIFKDYCIPTSPLSCKKLFLILWRGLHYLASLTLTTCENRLNKVPGEEGLNYSDHLGVYAEFTITDEKKKVSLLLSPCFVFYQVPLYIALRSVKDGVNQFYNISGGS